ncbi:unnamed protein product [Notodromas monacha]|uniref:Protein SET n=1 Tax=Notodromas monacha TaxID=399045 RepID=A0A7R9GCT6_9CRUS|nr:unnamed protein product [Notodromas monacha]CAG0916440.1 unnamed protein product [Notodromas monacha]
MAESGKTKLPDSAEDNGPVSKKARVADEVLSEPAAGSSGGMMLEDLPKEISEALDELDSCQREIDALNEKASEEILKVEQKFNILRRPMYGNRTEIIARIPQFWLTAFTNHPQISPMIDEEEEKCLQYLRDMVVDENDDIKSGYKIKFIFEDNPYFDNNELVKDIHLPYESPEDRPSVESTEIKWKAGMDLLKVKEKKPKRRGRAWADNTVSFLEWLTHGGDPSGDEIAEILKDDMWPNPMQYYLAPEVELEANGLSDEDEEEEGVEEESDVEPDTVVILDDEEEGEGEEDSEDNLAGEEAGGENEPTDELEKDEEP